MAIFGRKIAEMSRKCGKKSYFSNIFMAYISSKILEKCPFLGIFRRFWMIFARKTGIFSRKALDFQKFIVDHPSTKII